MLESNIGQGRIIELDDIDARRQFNSPGLSLHLRYRLLDRETAPFGFTAAAEPHGNRIDEISGAKGRDKRPSYDALLKAVARREVDLVAAWSVDRLGRSMQDLVAFLRAL